MAITRDASSTGTVCLISAAIFASVLLGCHTLQGEDPVPAPPLRSVGDQEVRTKMGQLARHMVTVDEMIQVSDPADSADRDRLWQELNSMLRVVQSFGKGPLDPHHEQFGWRLRALRDNIQLAQTAVYANPPEYDLARSVSSSCTYCHTARRHALNPANEPSSHSRYTRLYRE